MEKKTIGGFLSALRKANGLTQKQLAEKLNVSDKAVSRWERDEAMPDLTLIPVLAEIFGVTSDELLRGERRNQTCESPAHEEKTEKQRKRILTEKRTKLRVRSTITVGIGLLGLIAAMICNFGFLRAYIGFMVGCVFYLGAIVSQIIFTLLHLSGMDEDLLTPQELGTYRMDACRQSSISIGTVLVLLAASLPLILYPWDTYQGLDAGTWALYALLYAAIACIICIIAYAVTVLLLARRGLLGASDKKLALHKLRLRFSALAVLVLCCLFIMQSILNSFLPSTLMTGKEFRDWDSFVEYMETPIISDGSIAYTGTQQLDIWGQSENFEIQDESVPSDSENVIIGEDGSVSIFPENPKEQILDGEGNVLCEFTLNNEEVNSWKVDWDGDDFTVTVYTWQDRVRAIEIMDGWINPIINLLYPVSLLVLFLIYRKKARKLQ